MLNIILVLEDTSVAFFPFALLLQIDDLTL